MSRLAHYTHEFVEFIPDELEPGVFYVSTTYATAAHLCMCGCGHEVITPITPHQWRLIFDGASVSLAPSIGSWSLACESHYWLDRGTVSWVSRWSHDRVEAGRAGTRQRLEAATGRTTDHAPTSPPGSRFGWLRGIWAALRR